MTPQAQVLQTMELLDLVLTPLSMRDLIAAKLVSYLWNDTISKSSACQRTLYLLPEQCTPESKIEDVKNASTERNPLFLQRFIQQAALYALRTVNPKVHFLGIHEFVLTSVDAFADPAASWRNMLLYQPPVSMAGLTALPNGEFQLGYAIDNVDGVRMGDVVALFTDLIRESSPRSDDRSDYVDLLSKTVTGEGYWNTQLITRISQACSDQQDA
jgi:hypothetical protein